MYCVVELRSKGCYLLRREVTRFIGILVGLVYDKKGVI